MIINMIVIATTYITMNLKLLKRIVNILNSHLFHSKRHLAVYISSNVSYNVHVACVHNVNAYKSRR